MGRFGNEVNLKRAAEHRTQRREYLRKEREDKYQQCIGEFIVAQKQIVQHLMKFFVRVSGTDVIAFNKSVKFYGQYAEF